MAKGVGGDPHFQVDPGLLLEILESCMHGPRIRLYADTAVLRIPQYVHTREKAVSALVSMDTAVSMRLPACLLSGFVWEGWDVRGKSVAALGRFRGSLAVMAPPLVAQLARVATQVSTPVSVVGNQSINH